MTIGERGAHHSTTHPLTRARLEAMHVLERCIAEGTSQAMEVFLESYLVQDPPPLLLLIQISDDVEARRLHVQTDYLLSSTSTHTLILLEQISDFLADWISGVATRLAQRTAMQRGAVVAMPLLQEHMH